MNGWVLSRNLMSMQSKDFEYYWKVVPQRLPVMLLISVAAAFAAFVIVRQAGPGYQVHWSYLVSLQERDTVNEYRFDGYYALSATDLFAATLAKWIQAPETIVAAYRAAGFELPNVDPRGLTKQVEAVKSAPQLVEVTVRHSERETAEALAAGLQEVMIGNVEQYHDQGVPAVSFGVVATEPWTGTTRLSAPVIVTATFLFTFFITLNAILLIHSLKRT